MAVRAAPRQTFGLGVFSPVGHCTVRVFFPLLSSIYPGLSLLVLEVFMPAVCAVPWVTSLGLLGYVSVCACCPVLLSLVPACTLLASAVVSQHAVSDCCLGFELALSCSLESQASRSPHGQNACDTAPALSASNACGSGWSMQPAGLPG
jgi:hypothetical protein